MDGLEEEFLERLAAPAFLIGPDRTILAANTPAREALGAERGKTCPHLGERNGGDCRPCPVRRAADSGRAFGGPAPCRGGESEAPFYVTAVPAGKGIGSPILVIAQDGTPLGERAGESQAAFVGSITHALKGALNALEGGLFFLESGHRSGNPSRIESGTAMARRGIWKARSLVGNVLTWARPRELHRAETGAAALAEAALETFRRRPDAGPLTMEVSPGGAVPVPGDPMALEAMLLCLLEVAQEAAAPSGGGVRLRVGAEGRWAVFEVAHTGTPCPADTLAGALEPSYRPIGSDRSGLWVHGAFRIAAAHGGTVEAESGEGGQVFRAKVPAGSCG